MGGFTAHAFLLATIIRSALTQQTVFDRWKDSDDIPEWTTFPRPINRVAVVGAGPSGLQAATHLLDANLTVRLFEKAPSPGGNWFYTEETPVREDYPEANSTTPDTPPKEFPATKFYEEGEDCITLDERWRAHWQPRPHNPDTPWLLSAHDLERNVRAYASLHGLNSNDEPSSPPLPPDNVIGGPRNSTQWSSPPAISPRPRFLKSRHRQLEHGEGERPIQHDSLAIVPPSRALCWQVLIVGASVSATHLSRIIAPFAHRLVASIRVGSAQLLPGPISLSFYQPNKYRDGYGLDILFSFAAKTEIVPEIASFEPLDGNDAGIRAGRIKLVDGTILDGIDEVILATGYRTDTFLPDLVNPRTLDNLDWTGHYIHDPTLAYMFTGNAWTHAGYQGYAFAKVWTGKARLPSRERMWRDYENKKYQFGGPFDHLPQEGLRKLYVAWLNSESLELGGQFVEPLPLEKVGQFYDRSSLQDFLSHENWTHFDNLPFIRHVGRMKLEASLIFLIWKNEQMKLPSGNGV
ncbi:FAD/NAD(P)-binding domain-containing protein [Mycena olivaceomarginata]|nr:FAD/NAD(P)-binding domain-containing protein [Mycena olivaceomarginata]